jgi:hypothetical protein
MSLLKKTVLKVAMGFSLFCMHSVRMYGEINSHHCLDPQAIPGLTTTVHEHSTTEPVVAVNPKNKWHIVTAWEQGVISNGGALEIAISYSKNGGKTWHKSKVPFQICDGGIIQRVVNPWLAFSENGKVLYLTVNVINATLNPNTENQQGVVVAISKNGGKSWSIPRFLAASTTTLGDIISLDARDQKPTITSDRNRHSHAYVVWDRYHISSSKHSTTRFTRTIDNGANWEAHHEIYDAFPDLTLNNQTNLVPTDNSTHSNTIVVMPHYLPTSAHWQNDHWGDLANKERRYSGHLLNFMVRKYARPGATDFQYLTDTFPYQYTLFDVAVIRSLDHGLTWEKQATLVSMATCNPVFTDGYTYNGITITGGVGEKLHTADGLLSCAVNPHNGFLYVVWQTGLLRQDGLPQIALSTSRDGGKTWSFPIQINQTPQHAANNQAFTPFVAVTKEGYVGVLYFDLRKDRKSNIHRTKVNAWLDIYKEVTHTSGGSTGIGLNFIREVRLSHKSYIAQHAPHSDTGYLITGDYPFLVEHKGYFYATYTKTNKGPFVPPALFFTSPLQATSLYLDTNHRQPPYLSIVKSSKKMKGKLLKTYKLHWSF